MVWLAVLLYVKIGEPDDGVPQRLVPKPLRQLTFLSAMALSVVLVTGTMVTGAGPHAGDKSIDAPIPRLGLDIVTLVYRHSALVTAYLCLLIGLAFALLAVRAPRPVTMRLVVLVILVALQGMVGTVQFFTGVPAALVAVHVAGAAICTGATAALWASMRQRTQAEPVESRLDGERELSLP
jgi:cytochrome c oxidase assembly protein subunit 15